MIRGCSAQARYCSIVRELGVEQGLRNLWVLFLPFVDCEERRCWWENHRDYAFKDVVEELLLHPVQEPDGFEG